MQGIGLPIDWDRTKDHLATISLGRTIHAAPEMPSTQIPAKAAAREGAPHGTVYVTDHQSAGRGRRDRGWQSLPGRDLTFSVILRPPIRTADAHMLNLAAALAVSDTLRAVLRPNKPHISIKWPNDVLVEGKKICGILCEGAGDEQALAFAVLGIGLNVNRTISELPPLDSPDRPGATSLAVLLGRTIDRPRLFAALLAHLEHWTDKVASAEGRTQLIEAYKADSSTLGRSVKIITDEGDFTGTATDITQTGAIVVQGDFGTRTFDAGDVVHARPQ